MFSILHASLFRRPPFPESDRLVVVGLTVREPGQPERQTTLPTQAYEFVRDRATTLSGVAAFTNPNFNVTGYDEAERVQVEVVSANYFDVLRVRAASGRGFRPAEDSIQGAAPVVVVSHALWQRRFAADPALVGKRLAVNRVSLEVIGVMPRGFQGVSG